MSFKKQLSFLCFCALLISGAGLVVMSADAGDLEPPVQKSYETLLQKQQREAVELRRVSPVPMEDVKAVPVVSSPSSVSPVSSEALISVDSSLKTRRQFQKEMTYRDVERLYALRKKEVLAESQARVVDAEVEEKISVEITAKPVPASASKSALDEDVEYSAVNGYVLGAGDKLKVTIFGEKDLSGAYTVNDAGQISFPLIGEVSVAGIHPLEARDKISALLQEDYLKEPNIAIEVEEFRPFYIIGEVRQPGSYTYVAGMSVLNAVALAGGFTYRADEKDVEILRKLRGRSELFESQPVDTKVFPGDIVSVQERFF